MQRDNYRESERKSSLGEPTLSKEDRKKVFEVTDIYLIDTTKSFDALKKQKKRIESCPLLVLIAHIIVKSLEIYYLKYCQIVTLPRCFVAFICLNASN